MKLAGLLIVFLMFVGISSAQHHGGGGGNPHSGGQPHANQPYHQGPQQHYGQQGERRERDGDHRGGYDRDRRGGWYGYRGNEYHGWYANRPEYRGFGWGHYYGWHYRPYMYLGQSYCYPGAWGGPFFTFGYNSSRWRVLNFDLAIVNGWYPGGCDYVVADPDHYGWYLLYDQQTGQYVHVEQY